MVRVTSPATPSAAAIQALSDAAPPSVAERSGRSESSTATSMSIPAGGSVAKRARAAAERTSHGCTA